MITKTSRFLISIALLALAAPVLASDVVVIVNKANDNTIDKALVAKIYIGESKVWANGGTIAAYDLPEDNPARASFDNDIVGRSPASLKTMWAQNVFTGKGLPPKSAGSDDDVKKAVAANKNGIGYVKAASVDDSVKVVIK